MKQDDQQLDQRVGIRTTAQGLDGNPGYTGVSP
jgi:hypothetical protein